MNGVVCTAKSTRELRERIIDTCGGWAGRAAEQVFEDAHFHGKNHVYRLVDQNDHLVVVLDCDCPDHVDHRTRNHDSVITQLCLQGVVIYYYHSIKSKHHHVCLALKKKGAVQPADHEEDNSGLIPPGRDAEDTDHDLDA